VLGGPDSTNFLLVVVQEAIQLLNLRQTILAKEESDLVGGLKEGGLMSPSDIQVGSNRCVGVGGLKKRKERARKMKNDVRIFRVWGEIQKRQEISLS